MRPARLTPLPPSPKGLVGLFAFSLRAERSVYIGEGLSAAIGVLFAAVAFATVMSPLVVWYLQ